MGHAREKFSAKVVLGASVLATVIILPFSAPRASTITDGVSLFTPGSGCGSAETLVGTDGLLARIRADAALTRRHNAAKAKPSGRNGEQQASRAPAPARSARKAPSQAEQESRGAFLRSFYTCSAATLPNLTEGTGWRLVGPLRQS